MSKGPNSFLEWVVGRNLPNHSRRPRGPRRIARIDWSTDDDSGEDTVALTVPRRCPSRPKKVRFGEAEPRKSALKLPSAAAVAEESLGKSSGATTNTDTTGNETDTEEGSDSDCPCSKCDTERNNKQERVDEATHARHKQQKAKKARAIAHDKNKKIADDSETAVESASDVPKGNNSNHKKKKNKRDARKSTSGALDDTETSGKTESPNAAEKKKDKRMEERKAKDGKAKPLSCHPPADIRQPDLLLPISSSVLQIEHVVEAADDPKPNAFYDPVNGVMRMYHGPAYANPYGRLYPQRTYNHQHLPVGVPHPTNNPWYYGFADGQAKHPVTAPQVVQALPGPPVTPAHPAPAPPGAHPWFQGHGTAVLGRGDADASPSASAAERKKTKAAAMNAGTPLYPPAPPSKLSSNGDNASAGSKSRKDTQTLWGDIHNHTSNGADGRGNGTWGAHDSKGINDFLERLSAKYSNSPKSSKSKSPNKERGSQRADSNGWVGGGDQNGFANWNNNNNNTTTNNDINDANNQRGNNNGNSNSDWGNENINTNNNDANQWGNNNGNWGTPVNFGDGNASNGNWNGGAGSQTASNQGNMGEQAGVKWGDSGSKKSGNDNNTNNWGDGNNTGQTGMAWGNTANDQANNQAGGGWGGSNKNGSEHGSKRSAKSNTYQPANTVGPPGAWPDDGRQAQASPRGFSSGAGGNVAGASDDWGDASKNQGGGAGWQDPGAAQSTTYWDNEGRGTEKDTTGPSTGGNGPYW